MIKSFYIIFYTLILCVYSSHANADIRFIMDTPASSQYDSEEKNYNLDKQTLCTQNGYTKTSCSEGFILADVCPYLSNYFATCCPEEYRYTQEQCQAQNKNIGPYTCGGYYKCI